MGELVVAANALRVKLRKRRLRPRIEDRLGVVRRHLRFLRHELLRTQANLKQRDHGSYRRLF
jgi:hypothetical protein